MSCSTCKAHKAWHETQRRTHLLRPDGLSVCSLDPRNVAVMVAADGATPTCFRCLKKNREADLLRTHARRDDGTSVCGLVAKKVWRLVLEGQKPTCRKCLLNNAVPKACQKRVR